MRVFSVRVFSVRVFSVFVFSVFTIRRYFSKPERRMWVATRPPSPTPSIKLLKHSRNPPSTPPVLLFACNARSLSIAALDFAIWLPASSSRPQLAGVNAGRQIGMYLAGPGLHTQGVRAGASGERMLAGPLRAYGARSDGGWPL